MKTRLGLFWRRFQCGVSSNGDAIMAYDRWIDGNWQIQANNASQFRGRVMKNITGTWVATSVYSSEDLSGEYHLYCLELDRSNLTLSNWLDGSLNDYKVSDPLPIRENERFSLMGNRGRTQPIQGSVAEVIAISSVSETDRLQVQNYLARKWALPIGQNLGSTGGNWQVPGLFGNSMIDFNGSNGGAVIHASGLDTDLASATISLWINPSSSNMHLLANEDSSSVQWNLSLESQRPLFNLSGLNQQSLPGVDNEKFWEAVFSPK